ncbi:DUF3598 family protein [Trichocoleus sp. FACHB-262]|uniref:DUF3598 family protein n=1 Tax=Trichocoleus sp. FACHB-262 TaxID=2692869 RepID=UPI001682F12D|nr:DUF3598 family protein [Trichocoleus sp. FACHB-262]MBD2123731.1 DUF3598 family protein [Trichocoleus sp. FACHB-262]
MKSQWECLLENLGDWRGSFTQLGPDGEVLANTPTLVAFEGINNNQTMRQLVRRFLPSQDASGKPEIQDKILEYSSLNRGTLFFENGAFSQGSMQFGPFAEFGVELGLIAGDQRLRLVQLFNRDGNFHQLTLIRETRAGTEVVERPLLQLPDLLGEWQGEAVTIYPDWRSPHTYPTRLKLHQESPERLVQQLTFGIGDAARTITSTARIDGSILHFDQSAQAVRVLLLPNGASSNCPQHLQVGQPFVLEVGWLIEPDLRQRMVRRYDAQGGWSSLTLVTEQKISAAN